MTKNPKVTICIPVYNSAKVFSECLDSVGKIDYDNYKVVILDDRSTDDIKSIVQHFNSIYINKFEYIRNDIPGTAEDNYNRCINHVSSDFFTIYHADDIYYPTILSKEVEFLQKNTDCACVFTLSRHVNQKKEFTSFQFIPKELRNKEAVILNRDELVNITLKYGSIIHTPSAMFRTGEYKKNNYSFNARKYNRAADTALWLEISKTNNIGIIQKHLTDYRLGDDSYSFSYARERIEVAEGIGVLEDLLLESDVKNYDINAYYLDLLKLKDLSDIKLNSKINGHSHKNKPSFLKALKFLFRPKIIHDIYHLKIIIWSLVVSVSTYHFSPIFLAKILFKIRFYRQ
jgi:glycosyltransferase involved in cell wall biosynthesis